MKDRRKLDKKKKRMIILASIFGVIGITCSVFVFLIMDLSLFPYTDQNLTNEQVINRQLALSLNDAETNKSINFEINQDSLNQLLINSRKTLQDNSGYRDFYVDIEDNNYIFEASINLKLISSKVYVHTTLTNENGDFIFNINKVKLGKLGGKRMLNKEVFDATFANAGLNIKLDIENNRLIYSKDDIRNDFNNMLHINNNNLTNIVINNMDLNYDSDNPFKVSGNLSMLIENNEVSDCSLEGPHYASYEATKQAINNATQNVRNVLSQSDEIIIDTANNQYGTLKDLQPKGEGINSIVKKEIQTLPTNPSSYSGTTKVASVSESQLDDVLHSSNILGKNAIFYDKTQLSYLVIDRLYSDIFTNENGDKFINYSIGLNVNGLETRVVVETKYLQIANEFEADFDISHIYYGNKLADDSTKSNIKELFKMIIQSINDSWISYKENANKVSFDFSKLIKDDGDLAVYKDIFYDLGGTRAFDISSNKVNETGEFSLYFTK